MKILGSTVRLQFNHEFTFDDAAAQVGYYAKLGITHYYASPIYTARKGSMHGYDVVDFSTVNPELGGEQALRAMVAKLRQHGMGLVVDLVPNHMAVGEADNLWWLGVLEDGEASRYAQFFDIDWNPPDDSLRGKLLAPFLGKPYPQALADGDLKLGIDRDAGSIHVDYGPHRFPVKSADHADVLRATGGDPANFSVDALDALLQRQHYRLADWHEASRSINWRRFFDVTSLAAIRADRDEVFEATHAMPLRLYEEGLFDGFRIDHIDGLADPARYLARLRERLELLHAKRPQEFALDTPWLVVEKILSRGERLRDDWQADGATGYKFMDAVSGLLHDPAGEAAITALWHSFTGETGNAESEVYRARKELAEGSFAAEVLALTMLVLDFAAADASLSSCLPLGPVQMQVMLLEFLAHFPIYRSYVGEDEANSQDRAIYGRTLRATRAQWPADDPAPLTILERWIDTALAELPAEATADDAALKAHEALQRMQKLLPALDAKSVEDTVFYRYGRMLSRNEVGSWPGQFATTAHAFHALNLDRARRVPRSLLATATHDQKRGEDNRVRLAVLSELPQVWMTCVRNLAALTGSWRGETGAPSPADELMLYQTLVGAWPNDLDLDDEGALERFHERVAGWQKKALREAKLRTSWSEPDEGYEDASRAFLQRIFDSRDVLLELRQLVMRIAPLGALNALSQTLLRLTVPGVPDLYQGADFWDLSLVDPDNRRPVDYDLRTRALDEIGRPASLLSTWQDGRVKQALICSALQLRSEFPALFASGRYEALSVEGPGEKHVLAFARRDANDVVIVVVARLAAGLVGDPVILPVQPMVPSERWGETNILLPDDAPSGLVDALNGTVAQVREGRLHLSEALDAFPAAAFHFKARA